VRRLLAVCVSFAGLAVAGAAFSAPSPERGAGPPPIHKKCEPPQFRGASYGFHTLQTTWLRVGASIGAADVVTLCVDTCTEANPCRIETEPRRVHRLRGIAPRVAVSLGGSSRQLLINAAFCQKHIGDGVSGDAALVRCLRRASS
jgi:hypothetical protein